jgi:hypothetical protein
MSIASFFLFVNRGCWLVWNAISVEFAALSFIESQTLYSSNVIKTLWNVFIPTKQFSDEITNELNNMYDNGDIDEKTLEYDITD